MSGSGLKWRNWKAQRDPGIVGVLSVSLSVCENFIGCGGP